MSEYRGRSIGSTLNLVLSYTGRLLVIRWVQIVLLLYPICFFYFYDRDFIICLSDVNQDVKEAFNLITHAYENNDER